MTRPDDVQGWIQERIRHGEHVVALNITGPALLHPGCDRDECEFIGHPLAVPPTPERPVYVAEVGPDGVRPFTRAHWDDVVIAEDPTAYETFNEARP